MSWQALPIVLLFHGGGFTENQYQYTEPVRQGLQAHGIVAKNAHYPLGRGLDAAYRSALRQVRRYQRRGYRVYVYGHSAGACMATWLAATHHARGAVAMAPVTDMLRWAPAPSWPARRRQVWGSDSAVLRLSPLRRLTRRSNPTTLVHSSNDSVVPWAQSLKYHRRARRLGVPSKLVTTTTDHHQDIPQVIASIERMVK